MDQNESPMNIVFLDAYSIGSVDVFPISQLGNYTSYFDTSYAKIIERCINADIVIINKIKFTREIIDKLPNLKLICVAATGVNNVDVEYAKSKSIEVKNVPNYSTESVAEATFAFALMLMRNLAYYDKYVKEGEYTRSGRIFHTEKSITEIRGKEWGIIGMGNIGQRVATIAKAFGAKISYYSTSGKNLSAGYPCKSLDEILCDSDIISIHAPLNPQTEHLINYECLQQMKPSAILINVGRGNIINEADLARALNEELIAGAGIDVFACEPIDPSNPLLSVTDKNKLILTPHGGWASLEARKVLVERIAHNILEFIQ